MKLKVFLLSRYVFTRYSFKFEFPQECDHDIKSIELQLVRVEVVESKDTRLIEGKNKNL